ncbi:MAG: GNAT family N-acetyltransferase [Mycetocola sp.]
MSTPGGAGRDKTVAHTPDLLPQRITRDDLTLTPLQQDDAAEMVNVLHDRDLYAYTGGEPPSLDELNRRYARQIGGVSPDGTQRWLNWIVRFGAEPVGYVQATVTPGEEHAVAELAWVIGTRWQGRGIATRSALMMQAWLRERGISHWAASIHPDHAASAAVAARLGLRPSGSLNDDGEQLWRWPSSPLRVGVRSGA